MKTLAPLLLLTLAAGCLHAADKTPPPRTPIRPISECMRIDQINDWHVLDARTATVSNGPHYYRVNLAAHCPRLGFGPSGLMFRANDSNRTLGNSRICGEVGETVRSTQQPPCAIQSVVKISKSEYQRLNKHARKSGSAADQPTLAPHHP
jgi:hypothetical protein